MEENNQIIQELKNIIIQKDKEIEQLQKQIEWQKNEIAWLRNRNAGRYPVFSDRDKAKIIADYQSGLTMRQTAKINGCSVSYVHKVIHELK